MATTPNGRWSPDGTDGIDDIVADLAMMQATNESADNVTRGLITAPTVASQAARDIAYAAPVQGNRVFRADTGWEETYFAAYNASTNPGGATPAGWYPTAGAMPRYAIHRVVSSAITTGTWTDWQWLASTVVENRGLGFSVGAGAPTNILVPYKGWYDVTFETAWSNGTADNNQYYARITSDGTAPFNSFQDVNRAKTGSAALSVNKPIDVTILAGTYIRTGIFHTDPTNLTANNPKVVVTFRAPTI